MFIIRISLFINNNFIMVIVFFGNVWKLFFNVLWLFFYFVYVVVFNFIILEFNCLDFLEKYKLLINEN